MTHMEFCPSFQFNRLVAQCTVPLPRCATPSSTCSAHVNLNYKSFLDTQCLAIRTVLSLLHAAPLQAHFLLPFLCSHWVWDSSLKCLSSLISITSWILQFGVHLPCQKLNLPILFKMCIMRLPKCRVLFQSTFRGLPQLQIELMIAHWKSLYVYVSFHSSHKSFGHSSWEKFWFSQGHSRSASTLLRQL